MSVQGQDDHGLSDLYRLPWTVEAPRDAADECSHGRLPGDTTPPCGCWSDFEGPVAA